jgi:ABC-type uncharacterized transport system auxiliary subunit
MSAVKAALALVVLASCGGKVPETRYYQLAAPPAAGGAGDQLLVLEPLATDGAYDDERIVYRTSPYRLDYYQYHRWSAAPGVLIGNYLEQALERSGRFRGVVRELDPAATVVLGGRVVALEEIDESRTQWRGHVVIELRLTDARTNSVLWTEQLEDSEPLTVQSPEGLARALSTAMARIAARCTPAIAEVTQRQAVARGR